MRKIDPEIVGTEFKDTQIGINAYADNAAEIALVLVPEEGERPRFTMASLTKALKDNFTPVTINSSFAKEVFSTFNQFYRVRITTAMNEVEARLEVVLKVPRNLNRTGKKVEVLQFRME